MGVISRVICGDALDVLRTLEAESVHAVVTDPPYGLRFMGAAWDHGVPGEPFWRESLRVAKPGAHLVAFGGTRTFHRLTCAIEDAGWEIRDCLSWLYGSGFPKSENQHGAWEGWGSALKPGWEPILLARKPLCGTIAENLATHGCGALNIDACRLPVTDEAYARNCSGRRGHADNRHRPSAFTMTAGSGSDAGRWPANVTIDQTAAELLDQQAGERVSGKPGTMRSGVNTSAAYGAESRPPGTPMTGYGDRGGPSRFFYCPKASRAERDAGLHGEKQPLLWSSGTKNPGSFQSPNTDRSARNPHPTVKPIELMRWLVRLVTPPGRIVLDPFMGSGTTGIAAACEGASFVGIDKVADYVEIARRRIEATAPLFARVGT